MSWMSIAALALTTIGLVLTIISRRMLKAEIARLERQRDRLRIRLHDVEALFICQYPEHRPHITVWIHELGDLENTRDERCSAETANMLERINRKP